MAPKTDNGDLSTFDDLFYPVVVAPSSSNDGVGFWDNGTSGSNYGAPSTHIAPNSPSQLQVKTFLNKNDIPATVVQQDDDDISTSIIKRSYSNDTGSGYDEFSFMQSPPPSRPTSPSPITTTNAHIPTIEHCFSAPECTTIVEESDDGDVWEIKQSYTLPSTPVAVAAQNPFDMFDSNGSSSRTLKTTNNNHYEIVQASPSNDGTMYSNYTYDDDRSSYVGAGTTSFDLASPSFEPTFSGPAMKSFQEDDVNHNNKENVEEATSIQKNTAFQSSTRSATTTMVATEVLHPWSDSEKFSTVQDQPDMDTYHQGMKGDHGKAIQAGLGVGYTNANMSSDNIPTKLPVCWHKDLDVMKQQAKIERARQKLAQKKEKRKVQNKCKGMRAVFGNPKPLVKQQPETNTTTATVTSKTTSTTTSTTTQTMKQKTKHQQVLLKPNQVTKSTSKDPLKMLFANPKPLQKRPTQAVSRTQFV